MDVFGGGGALELSQREQVAITSRVFCLAAILGLSLVAGNATHDPDRDRGLRGRRRCRRTSPTPPGARPCSSLTAETLLVGLVMALTFPASIVLMPYLVVLPLLAGLFRGFPGVLITMLAQVAAIAGRPARLVRLRGRGCSAR